ncbi:MAG: LysM peptidoglycan-binding domain-containing protein [Actinomycetota bacterium]
MDAYEPPRYDPPLYDPPLYDPMGEVAKGGRILWTRVAIFGGSLLLVFLLGRASAPAGVSSSEFQKLKVQLAAATDQIAELKRVPSTPTPTPEAKASPTAPPGPQEYVVISGDTLGSIAKKFYGDSTLAHIIAEANNITSPSSLKVGQKLVIPAKPTSNSTATPRPTSSSKSNT